MAAEEKIADFEQGTTRIGCIRTSRHEMSRERSKRGKDKSESSHNETLSCKVQC